MPILKIPRTVTSQINVKDQELNRIQQNITDALDPILSAVSAANIIMQAGALGVVDAQPSSAIARQVAANSSVFGGQGNVGAYATLTAASNNASLELHGNAGIPYIDFATTPTVDYDYRIAQDPTNANRRLYIGTAIAGGGEVFIQPPLTLGGALSGAAGSFTSLTTTGPNSLGGTTTVTGTIVNNGPSSFKSVIGPFFWGPGAALVAATNTPLNLGAAGISSAAFPYYVPNAGSILGVTAFAAVSAGSTTLTVRAVRNGGAALTNNTVVGTGSTAIASAAAKGTLPFVAGDNLRVDIQASTNCNLSGTFFLFVEFTP